MSKFAFKPVSEHAKDIVQEFTKGTRKSAKDINCGGDTGCYDFAHELSSRSSGVEVMYGPHHAFAKHKNKYYDAEATEGVNHPNDLPHFKRFTHKWAPDYYGMDIDERHGVKDKDKWWNK